MFIFSNFTIDFKCFFKNEWKKKRNSKEKGKALQQNLQCDMKLK